MPLPPDPSPELQSYAHPERLVSADWLAGNLGQRGPGRRRVRRGRSALRRRPHSRCRQDRLAYRPQRPDGARLHQRRAVRGADGPQRHRPRRHRRDLRRQEQLVGGVRVVGVHAVRTSGRPAARRRARPVDLQTNATPRSTSPTSAPPTTRSSSATTRPIRAFKEDVLGIIGSQPLIDVRSPQEYTGERTHMPDYPEEGALRGGHIPTALSIPWGKAAETTAASVAAPNSTRSTGSSRRRQDGGVLPHRRAFQPHLVRADPPARSARACATTTARGPSGATPFAFPSPSATEPGDAGGSP